MESKIIKRFIAGAVCPRCGELDKIVMYKDEQGDQISECVRCDYYDKISNNITTDEIKTRVNQPRVDEQSLAHEEEVQSVTIIDPGKNSPEP
jgi:uncharacterized metal-binding protein (TIGR02443 family)